MSAPGSSGRDAKVQAELARLEREHANLTAEMAWLREMELGRLVRRVAKTMLIVAPLVFIAAQVLYEYRAWIPWLVSPAPYGSHAPGGERAPPGRDRSRPRPARAQPA